MFLIRNKGLELLEGYYSLQQKNSSIGPWLHGGKKSPIHCYLYHTCWWCRPQVETKRYWVKTTSYLFNVCNMCVMCDYSAAVQMCSTCWRWNFLDLVDLLLAPEFTLHLSYWGWSCHPSFNDSGSSQWIQASVSTASVSTLPSHPNCQG